MESHSGFKCVLLSATEFLSVKMIQSPSSKILTATQAGQQPALPSTFSLCLPVLLCLHLTQSARKAKVLSHFSGGINAGMDNKGHDFNNFQSCKTFNITSLGSLSHQQYYVVWCAFLHTTTAQLFLTNVTVSFRYAAHSGLLSSWSPPTD